MNKSELIISPIPKISVAMTTYNGEKYLREQLDSILSQSYRIHEIVISDDCSTDNTSNILKEYAFRFHGLLHINFNVKNLGYTKNFEKTIHLCTGDYIALCDQDDIWEKDKIKNLFEQIGNNCIIHSDARLIDKNGIIISNSYSRSTHKKIIPTIFDLLLRNYLTGCTTLFTKELYAMSFPFPDDFYHDWWLAIVAANCNGIAYTSKPLIRYRQHDSNVIGCGRIRNKNFKEKLRDLYYINKRRNNKIASICRVISVIEKSGLKIQNPEFKLFSSRLNNLNFLYKKKGLSFSAFKFFSLCFFRLHKLDSNNLLYSILQLLLSFICFEDLFIHKKSQVLNTSGE
jgi:glycosyltransferase involved in cell wall biosynthesis